MSSFSLLIRVPVMGFRANSEYLISPWLHLQRPYFWIGSCSQVLGGRLGHLVLEDMNQPGSTTEVVVEYRVCPLPPYTHMCKWLSDAKLGTGIVSASVSWLWTRTWSCKGQPWEETRWRIQRTFLLIFATSYESTTFQNKNLNKSARQNYTCMFTAALFVIAPNLEATKTSFSRWVDKYCGTSRYWNTIQHEKDMSNPLWKDIEET